MEVALLLLPYAFTVRSFFGSKFLNAHVECVSFKQASETQASCGVSSSGLVLAVALGCCKYF